MNTEERKLADVLHRFTPEPSRPVTVEQVAYRLISEPRLGRQARGRESASPRPRRGGLVLGRAFAPAAAAAAVIVIAGASAGIAVLANSHHNPPPSAGITPGSSAASSSPVSSPSQTSPSTEPTTSGTRIADGPWGAELIDHQTFNQDSLVSGDGSLYAYSNGSLDRIDPATGAVAATAPYNPPVTNPPVILGDTVWVVGSVSGGDLILHGYNAQTLAQTSSVQVPAAGQMAGSASNVVAGGPGGRLYVAAGATVVGVNPANGQVIQRIFLTGGAASSLAVSPDGSKLYIGVTGSSSGFRVLVYDPSDAREISASDLKGTVDGGNLIATPGGLWGTTGVGMSEWTWFAPDGDLTQAIRIGAGAGAGFASVPSYSAGVVWVGGSHTLTCASALDGHVMGTATLPTDHQVVEYFGSPAVLGQQAYSVYQDNASQQSGLVRMTPPNACTGSVSS